jgi:hypothetical protein
METPRISFGISFQELDPFLDHWASRYLNAERDERLYNPYIGTADLRIDMQALTALFTWKNGGVESPSENRPVFARITSTTGLRTPIWRAATLTHTRAEVLSGTFSI